MFDVITDHQVIAFGPDAMGLYATGEMGSPLVTAMRSAGVWTIHAEGVEDVTSDSRPGAIAALSEQALVVLGPSGPGGRGYSTMVPHGLEDLP